eukprot:3535859-Prymnesium_polylepis.1
MARTTTHLSGSASSFCSQSLQITAPRTPALMGWSSPPSSWRRDRASTRATFVRAGWPLWRRRRARRARQVPGCWSHRSWRCRATATRTIRRCSPRRLGASRRRSVSGTSRAATQSPSPQATLSARPTRPGGRACTTPLWSWMLEAGRLCTGARRG